MMMKTRKNKQIHLIELFDLFYWSRVSFSEDSLDA